MHVHVSRASLTPLQIGKLVVFLNAPENSAFITTIAQRDAGGYCKRKADKGKLTGLAACALARDDRYEALNLIPPHTVEFRIFKGTTRRDRAIKNIEFCAALCEYTETASLQSLRYTDFLAWLCKPEQRAAYATLYGFLTEQGRVPAVSKPKPLPSAKPLINTEGLLPVRQSGDGEQIDA
jgi:hypothetical protein